MRVFTKYLGVDITPATGFNDFLPAVVSWLLQEDIEIVGCQVGISWGASWMSVAGQYIETLAELSQTAVVERDGVILHARVQAQLGLVTSGMAYQFGSDHAEVMFPPADRITVKEEGYLYLNAWLNEEAALRVTLRPWAIIWYTKRGG